MSSSLVLNRRPKVPAEDTAAFGAIAERFRRAGALEQAVSLCREGLKKFPDHVSARVTLGWSLLDLGRYDEARLELEQVMRRAPDNLAAIRGLAELHDRFEHTLNLPMDGPGQWPPPADSVDLAPGADATAFEASNAPLAEQFETAAAHDEAPEFTSSSMTPPEMGLPLWTPEPAAQVLAEVPVVPVTMAGSGMSSVREIDAFAGAPIPVQPAVSQPAEEAVSAGMAVEELGVIDETLAALIAEADSLDAAAELQVVDAPSVIEGVEVGEFGNSIDLGAADLQSVEMSAVDLEVAPVSASTETVDLHIAPTPAAMETVELEIEPMSAVMETVELEVAAEPAVMEAVELEAVEPDTLAAQAEIQPIEEATHTAEVIAFTSRQSAAPEVAEAEPLDLLPDEQAVVPAVAARKGVASIAPLERMLARVQARRVQLMAESVA